MLGDARRYTGVYRPPSSRSARSGCPGAGSGAPPPGLTGGSDGVGSRVRRGRTLTWWVGRRLISTRRGVGPVLGRPARVTGPVARWTVLEQRTYRGWGAGARRM